MTDGDNRPLSERYRLAAIDFVDAEAAADLLENLKSAFLSQEMTKHGNIAVNKAEQSVKASPQWDDYIRKMVNARKAANLKKVEVEFIRMRFWEFNSAEATKRREMGM